MKTIKVSFNMNISAELGTADTEIVKNNAARAIYSLGNIVEDLVIDGSPVSNVGYVDEPEIV